MQISLEPPETKADLRWRMFGIPTRVSPLFWLGAALLGWHDGTTLAPLLIWIACVFVSVLLHEFGHALSARAFGAANIHVVLYQFGGLAIHEGGVRRWRRIVELLMGPGAGFILWGILFGLSFAVDYDRLLVGTEAELCLWRAIQYLLFINLVWGLFNLIPVYPLDGGQIAKELFVWRNDRNAPRLAHSFCMVVAIVAAAGFGAWSVVRTGKVDWLPVLMFAYFAYLNYTIRNAYRDHGGDDDYAPRQPWERDADWWKKGGR